MTLQTFARHVGCFAVWPEKEEEEEKTKGRLPNTNAVHNTCFQALTVRAHKEHLTLSKTGGKNLVDSNARVNSFIPFF